MVATTVVLKVVWTVDLLADIMVAKMASLKVGKMAAMTVVR